MKSSNFKRILSFFLAAIICFSILPAAFAQGSENADIDYEITNPYETVN